MKGKIHLMLLLKIHKEKRKWHPEVYAYRNWASAYEPYVPQLIAVYDAPLVQRYVHAIGAQPCR